MDCGITYTFQEINAAKAKGDLSLRIIVEEVIMKLCKCDHFVKGVFRYVLANNGTKEDAEDMVTEGLLKLSELLMNGKYQGGKIESYAFGVCKNVWRNEMRKTARHTPLDIPTMKVDVSEFDIDKPDELLNKLLLNCCSPDCLKILRLKYIDSLRHEQIAKIMKLKNANVSKSKLYDCINQLKKCFKKNPHYKELLSSFNIHIKNL